ncbi:MAG: AI-2E family transporter [Anaerolineae bacterium]|nr:AI-2E family transporter [Anaerolineae bacterium]
MTTTHNGSSPNWTSTTKAIIGLILVAIFAALVVRFQSIIAPLIGAFILAYLLYPIVSALTKKNKRLWRLLVTIIYLFFLIIIIGLLTWGGISIFNPLISLVDFIEKQVLNLPAFFDQLLSSPLRLGPFVIDLNVLPLENFTDQLLSYVQPILGSIVSVIGNFAGGAASSIGWVIFSLLISYFILAETEGVQERLLNIQIPGYTEDFRLMGVQLNRIWNAFLRGQLIIILITFVVYTILLGGLGVRYFYVLAVLAGLARFVPYIGPAVAWTTYGLVAVFQGTTLFGLQPFTYALIVVGSAWLMDVILDNVVTPRLWAEALKIHPAAVMISAIVAASLFGLVGVVLAAPTYATIKLFLDYVIKKMFDQDPWADLETIPPPEPLRDQMKRWLDQVRATISKISGKLFGRKKPKGNDNVTNTRDENPNTGRD